ncbi:hypothetical protein [Streptomyces sp. NPDC003006]
MTPPPSRASRAATVAVAVLLACAPLLSPAPPAFAEDPVTLSRTGQITDRADATAGRNGLGLEDLLLAVATHDRQFAYSMDSDPRPGDARPPSITPGPADPGGDGDSVAGDLVLPVLAAGAVVVAAAVAYRRRKKRFTTRTTPGGGRGGGMGAGTGARAGARAGKDLTPLPELDKQARLLLVETDDAIRTSTEELGFATARFGEDAAKPFGEALAYAQSELAAAFLLRQELDDAFPEDEPTRRRMLDEIVARCARAERRLAVSRVRRR